MTGPEHPLAQAAEDLFSKCAGDPEWRTAATLFRDALEFVPEDVARAAAGDPAFAESLRKLEAALPAACSADVQELLWSVFFPEGVGILGRESEKVAELR
jgi:hypothetical protein